MSARPFKNTNINRAEANGHWKGDGVGYFALHAWMRRHLAKPESCTDCGEIKRLELANISQEYKRDLRDWEWLCRRCHMIKDGRLKRFRDNAGNALRGRKQTPESIAKRIHPWTAATRAKLMKMVANRKRNARGHFIKDVPL